MIYFDTTYLVRCYFEDPGYQAVRSLVSSDRAGCVALGRVELISAFKRKLREKQIDERGLRGIFKQFDEDEKAGLWAWFPISVRLMAATCERLRQLPSGVFLRAGDAVHLTCAAEMNFGEIYSNDRHLLAATPQFGLQGINVT